MSYAYLFKYIIIGDTAVGKSCLLLRFTQDEFRPDHDLTIGAEFGGKIIEVQNTRLYLQIWDTAGQENYRSLTRSYYRGAAIAMIVYDVTRRDSFDHVKQWINEVHMNGNLNTIIVLVANKADLHDRRVVSKEEGTAFASAHGLLFVECSAKEGLNVSQAFELPASQLFQRIANSEVDLELFGHGVKVSDDHKQRLQLERTKKKGCC